MAERSQSSPLKTSFWTQDAQDPEQAGDEKRQDAGPLGRRAAPATWGGELVRACLAGGQNGIIVSSIVPSETTRGTRQQAFYLQSFSAKGKRQMVNSTGKKTFLELILIKDMWAALAESQGTRG